LRLGLDWDSRSKLQEFFRVAAGKIGDGANRPLVPEIAIGKGREVAHVNSAADDFSAALQNPERRQHKRTDRSKDDSGIKFLRWRFVRSAGPLRAEAARELLRRGIA
jgi:hypothetical protein